MNKKETIHQEFQRFMRDEMDESEKKDYIKSKRYIRFLEKITKTLKKLTT